MCVHPGVHLPKPRWRSLLRTSATRYSLVLLGGKPGKMLLHKHHEFKSAQEEMMPLRDGKLERWEAAARVTDALFHSKLSLEIERTLDYWGWPKSSFVFFPYEGCTNSQLFLTSFATILIHYCSQLPYQVCF